MAHVNHKNLPFMEKKLVGVDKNQIIKLLLLTGGINILYQVPWTFFSDGTGFTARVLKDPNPTQDVVSKLYFGGPMLLSYLLVIVAIIVIISMTWYLITKRKNLTIEEELLRTLKDLNILALISALTPLALTTFATIMSWLQYMLYLNSVDLIILIWIGVFAFFQGAVLFFVIYLTWQFLGID